MIIKFADPQLGVRFAAVHKKTKDLIRRFALWSSQEGLPAPVVTGLDRTPDFYAKNNLPEKKFTWHFALPVDVGATCSYVICAVDLRTIHYTKAQLAKAEEWFRKNTDSSYELVTKLHGTGPHIHVAYKDFALRKAWEALQQKEKKDDAGKSNV